MSGIFRSSDFDDTGDKHFCRRRPGGCCAHEAPVPFMHVGTRPPRRLHRLVAVSLGGTVLPIARATLLRPVERDREPATFALAIAVDGVAAAGAGGLAALRLGSGDGR